MDYCSLWFEGNWATCCMIHDASGLSFQDHLNLGLCVAKQGGIGHLLMGTIMFSGVFLFNGLYQRIKKRNKANV